MARMAPASPAEATRMFSRGSDIMTASVATLEREFQDLHSLAVGPRADRDPAELAVEGDRRGVLRAHAQAHALHAARAKHRRRVLVQHASEAVPAALGRDVEEIHVAHTRIARDEAHLRLADDASFLPQVRIAFGNLRHARTQLREVHGLVLAHLLLDAGARAEARDEGLAPECDAGTEMALEVDGLDAKARRAALEPQHAFGLALLDAHRLPAAEARLLESADRGEVAFGRAREARPRVVLREHDLVDEATHDARAQPAAEAALLADEEVHARLARAAAELGRVIGKDLDRVRLDIADVLAVEHDDEGLHRVAFLRARAVLRRHLHERARLGRIPLGDVRLEKPEENLLQVVDFEAAKAELRHST